MIYFGMISSFHSERLSVLALPMMHGHSQEWNLILEKCSWYIVAGHWHILYSSIKDECKAFIIKFKWNYILP